MLELYGIRIRRQLTIAMLAGRRAARLASPEIPERGTLRWFWLDGLFANTSESLMAAYVPLYALAWGATNAQIGLMSSLNSLLGTMTLLPGARLAEWSGQRKAMVVWCSTVARLTLLMLVFVPWLGDAQAAIYAVIILTALRGIFGNLALPAWTSLAADIVPQEQRGRYFASRNLVMGVAAILAPPFAGQLINWFPFPQGYQLDFGLAFAVGIAATFCYSRILEPRIAERPEVRGKRLPAWQRLRDEPNFLWLCATAFIWNLSLQVAGPFFNVYLVGTLGATAVAVGLLGAVSAVTALPGQQVFGRLVDRWGTRRTQILTGLAIPLLPWGWMFIQSPWHVVPINVLGGFVWAGYNLANFNMLLQITPDDRRMRYVAFYNTVIGLATAIGALAGGVLADVGSFHLIFFVSGAGRVLSLILFILFVREP